MVGDGVNDVLALKQADIGVAMNSGAAAARDVSDIVLLKDSFAHLPALSQEGDRIIHNIKRIMARLMGRFHPCQYFTNGGAMFAQYAGNMSQTSSMNRDEVIQVIGP